MSDCNKNALRNTLKQQRAALSGERQSAMSSQICQRVETLEAYQKATRVALYFAVNGEVNLADLWRSALTQGKCCYFPVVHSDRTLTFLPAAAQTPLKPNRFGILEPDAGVEQAVSYEALDVIILPLLAFDVHCSRLGMGAGYYDRTLQNNTKTLLLGVAYDFQQVDHLELQPWDVPLDAVITQTTVYWR